MNSDLTQKNRVLVVDDDEEILKLLSRYLKEQGFEIVQASSIETMKSALDQNDVDLIVLDIVLPDGSGLDTCIDMRRSGDMTPIILLTAMREDVDRIMGLEMGADDYLPKPFIPRELSARIKAVLRRFPEADTSLNNASDIIVFSDFSANLSARTLTSPSGSDVTLTGAEFEILRFFLANPGRVIPRDQIMEATNRDTSSADRSIDVLLSRIRRKLRDEGCTTEIFKTIRNGGYQFTASVVRNP